MFNDKGQTQLNPKPLKIKNEQKGTNLMKNDSPTKIFNQKAEKKSDEPRIWIGIDLFPHRFKFMIL